MAKQTINIGTTANDGTGTPLRDSFDIVNDNFNEVYGKPDLSLVTNTLTLTKADGTTDTVDLAPYLDDTAIVSASIDGAGIATFVNSDTSSFTLDLSSLLDDTNLITSVDGGGGLEVDTTTGDVTVSISDDGVTHAKLEDRYTAIQDIATTTGTIDLEADKYAAFNLTGNLGTVTLDIHDIKTGQAIDIILSGADLSSAVITLDASVPFTTVSINKVGSTSIDTAAKNIIQVLCVDDTVGDAILTWAVASYATGTSV